MIILVVRPGGRCRRCRPWQVVNPGRRDRALLGLQRLWPQRPTRTRPGDGHWFPIVAGIWLAVAIVAVPGRAANGPQAGPGTDQPEDIGRSGPRKMPAVGAEPRRSAGGRGVVVSLLPFVRGTGASLTNHCHGVLLRDGRTRQAARVTADRRARRKHRLFDFRDSGSRFRRFLSAGARAAARCRPWTSTVERRGELGRRCDQPPIPAGGPGCSAMLPGQPGYLPEADLASHPARWRRWPGAPAYEIVRLEAGRRGCRLAQEAGPAGPVRRCGNGRR